MKLPRDPPLIDPHELTFTGQIQMYPISHWTLRPHLNVPEGPLSRPLALQFMLQIYYLQIPRLLFVVVRKLELPPTMDKRPDVPIQLKHTYPAIMV